MTSESGAKQTVRVDDKVKVISTDRYQDRYIGKTGIVRKVAHSGTEFVRVRIELDGGFGSAVVHPDSLQLIEMGNPCSVCRMRGTWNCNNVWFCDEHEPASSTKSESGVPELPKIYSPPFKVYRVEDDDGLEWKVCDSSEKSDLKSDMNIAHCTFREDAEFLADLINAVYTSETGLRDRLEKAEAELEYERKLRK